MVATARLDIFEPGDQTALLCVDVPEVQNLITEQLSAIGYKIHTGFSLDDLLLKLRTHNYSVVVIAEHFDASDLASNALLAEAVNAPAANRHKQFLALVGSSFTTNDELQAFQHSVDMVIALDDVVHLRPLMRRGLSRMQEFYAAFHESLSAAGAA